MSEPLITKKQIIAASGAVGLIFLTTIIGYTGWELNKPYIQYRESSYYKPKNIAVTSLYVSNVGYSDAEDVRVTISFDAPITDITNNNPNLVFTTEQGGIGSKSVVGTLSRISPSQSTNIYFALDNTENRITDGTPYFVKELSYKGGLGSKSAPTIYTVLSLLITSLIVGSIGIFLGYKTGNILSERNEFKAQLETNEKIMQKIINKLDSTQ